MPFLKQVKPLWDKSPLTLAELAELCGISESSASRYINGKVSPPADIAERILEVLGGGPVKEETPQDAPCAHSPIIMQIREIYQAQIATLQENHSARLAAIQDIYVRQIADLKRDKRVLFATLLFVTGLLLYFIFDALHGEWGFIRYAMTSIKGGTAWENVGAFGGLL